MSWVRELPESRVRPHVLRLAARALDFAVSDLGLARRPTVHWFREASESEYRAATPLERAGFKYAVAEAFTDGHEIWLSHLLATDEIGEVVCHEMAHCWQKARGLATGMASPGYDSRQREADEYAARHRHRFVVV